MEQPRLLATARICICQGVSARDFDGEWVVLDLHGGNYFGLDHVGGIVWGHLITGSSPLEIAKSLAITFDVTEEVSLQDVMALVNELVDRKLVQVCG
jgi:hypothetical protein